MNNCIVKLPDKVLTEKLVDLSRNETEIIADILLHLAEFDKRKLYRDLSYSSLFSYCIYGLGYSEPAAKRRITAARCIVKFPEVYQMFLERKVSLTTIAIFAPVLSSENKDTLLQQVAERPRAEVEWIAGRYNPARRSFDRIIPIVVQKLAEEHKEAAAHELSQTKNLEIPLGSQRPQVNSSENDAAELSLEERYKFEFSAGKAFKEKLDMVKALSSGKLIPGEARLENVFELLLDEYIGHHCSKKREERRIARELKKQSEKPSQQPKPAKYKRRAVSRRTKDKVLIRDGFRCTYVSHDGIRCNAKTGLQIDHITPRANGGGNTPENLRIYCAAHNRLAAEQALGKTFMEQFYQS